MLIFPENVGVLLCIMAIAAAHGVIDQLKINYGKCHSMLSMPFLLDQALHLLTLITASVFFPFTNAFWIGETGKGVLAVLFFFSFAMAWWNMSSIAPIKRFALISITFSMFAIPALIFLTPAYS
ncbi:MAG: DUF3307 domain-containing protein, partial [Patescibacteria group bacterium]